jgi:hypothetical protein
MDTGTHLEVVLNISEELNVIRKRDKEKSKSRSLKASYPGELVGMDTFLKGVGRIYQQTARRGLPKLWLG